MAIYILIFSAFCVSVLLSRIIIPRILVVAFRKRLFDMPDARKVHTGVVPRLGGISFMPTILFSVCFVTAVGLMLGKGSGGERLMTNLPEFFLLQCGLTLLYLTGVKDDLVGLRYKAKFVIQILCACLIPLSGVWINNFYGLFGLGAIPAWVGVPLTIFLTVFITNAINLIDGIDGLASGLSGAALLVFGCLYMAHGIWIYAMVCFATLGVLVPFFYYNVFGQVDRGRKIFMGDTGSLTLGYLLAFLAIRYSCYDPMMIPYEDGALIVAFSTLLVPALDVIRVVFYRWRHHKGLFSPDKSHIHHKFLAMGFTPRQAMVLIVMMACAFSCVNIFCINYVNNTLLFLFDVVVWTLLNLWFDRVRDRRQAAKEGDVH